MAQTSSRASHPSPENHPDGRIPETSTADARGLVIREGPERVLPPLVFFRPRPSRDALFQLLLPSSPLTQQAQVAEVAAVSAHFAAPAGLAATGVTVAGIKYMFVRGEENAEIYVKKVSGLPRACLHPNPLPPSSAEVVS